MKENDESTLSKDLLVPLIPGGGGGGGGVGAAIYGLYRYVPL